MTTACREWKENIVQLLIHVDKGWDVTQADGTKHTPACLGGNAKVVQLLIDKGCDVYQVDNMGHTPLTAHCVESRNNLVQLPIQTGYNWYWGYILERSL